MTDFCQEIIRTARFSQDVKQLDSQMLFRRLIATVVNPVNLPHSKRNGK